MTQIILSTGNVMSAGPTIIRKRGTNRSNLELVNSLQSSFASAKEDFAPATNGSAHAPTPVEAWTERQGGTLFVPRISWQGAGLRDEASQYEITVKLFFLRDTLVKEREQFAREALELVRRELGIQSIDLLVVAFPGISFEGDCEWEADRVNAVQGNLDDEVATWKVLEEFHSQGLVRKLGVSEFGSEKLRAFMERTTVRPTVDQINLHNCCNVPPPLKALAEKYDIQLNVHTDSTDILPCGTLREILGPQGAGVLADSPTGSDGLRGEITPHWVVRYMAFVQDRGVIENKGYFASSGWDEKP
ncbi:unnamed protein product [Clonostachys rosea f. rosea IK726]|uniref:GCS light chain n=2 Tax=Bionectria ochroleuca TaxID=29856 RepID=A0A0B7KEK3_BIOOC|nr:unnamed protein product [Clonostachys rosea f. rosea IK726]